MLCVHLVVISSIAPYRVHASVHFVLRWINATVQYKIA
jgi:hypothetical protein